MFGFFLNFFLLAVGGGNKHSGRWGLLQRFPQKYGPAAQPLDHPRVMDNLMPYIDRRAETRERALDNFNRAIHAGAKAARLREQTLRVGGGKFWHGNHASGERR